MSEAGGRPAFTAIIVDDEPLAVEGVRRLCDASSLVTIVGEATDGQKALELVNQRSPNAVFLDIAMPGMTGLDVAVALKAIDPIPHVVLVTANDNFATEAFDLAVVDYVLKPIDPRRLERAIERVSLLVDEHVSTGGRDAVLWVPYRGSVVRLPITEIQRVDAERDYVRVHDGARAYLVRATLTEIAHRLGDRFVRIHRSALIARDRVSGLRHSGGGSWLVIDRDGGEFPIGRTYLAEVRAALSVGS